MLDYTKSFIEQQFPVSKISKESYKERKAGASQTLTRLGKWWGRKPLILIRATILGVLMPISNTPTKDKEIFLKILCMDEDGLWNRKSKSISTKKIYSLLNPKERDKYFGINSIEENLKYINGLSSENKLYLQKLVFNRMSYDEKLNYCDRTENMENLPEEIWQEINKHLETTASSFDELVSELGTKRYGHNPRVGDCFSGGGSIPFEAARFGCDVYASDINPIAALLTWSSLNVISLSEIELEEYNNYLSYIYKKMDEQITKWGIEHNEHGDRADTYLYCYETNCPECKTSVPLLPSLVISNTTKTIAKLKVIQKSVEIDIVQNASHDELEYAKKHATVKNYNLICPNCMNVTSIPSIRGDFDDGIKRPYRYNIQNELRKWKFDDVVQQEYDIFSERLYCIRYCKEIIHKNNKKTIERYYTKPSLSDISKEKTVEQILFGLIDDWRKVGFIPNMKIESGFNTNQLTYEKGWTHWQHLFNPRQLLVHGLFLKYVNDFAKTKMEKVLGLLCVNKIMLRNTKLSMWDVSRDGIVSIYYNQSLNTLFNYGCKGLSSINFDILDDRVINYEAKQLVSLKDARDISFNSDIWITDPPYADAVNYHELTELFLSWDKKLLEKAFPDWYTDSKRVLAVKGTGKSFNESMIEIYKNLANHMPDNGTQVVMFTHQDVKVWAELAMILWSSGLRVVSAWNIATETDASGLKSGNYVKGTVLLTLKKQTSNEMAFQDELYDDIKREVQDIIDSMNDIDDRDDPDFTDADYLLASYAASLKVLTSYKEINGIDVKYWLAQSRETNEENPVEALINKAVKIAYDYLIPEGFDKSHWRDLSSEERFLIRGLEIEMNGGYKISSYQELARGFGVKDYADLFAEFRANSARLMTPSEFKMRNLNTPGFGSTTLRYLFVAINEGSISGSTVEGRAYLKTAYSDSNEYWFKKPIMIELLSFIAKLENIETMEHWHKHANSAKILREALKNEGI